MAMTPGKIAGLRGQAMAEFYGAKPRPKPRPVVRRPAAPPTPAVDPIKQQLDLYLKSRLDAINYERQQAAELASRRVRDLTGFTTATMQALSQIAPNISNAFAGAGDTMGALGTGYGQILNADSAHRAAGANAVLNNIDAPQGQQLSGGDAGGALAGIAGWLPQSMLNKQGSALSAAATDFPREAGWAAQLQLRSMLADAAQQDSDFSQKVNEAYGEIPELRYKLTSDRDKAVFDRQQFEYKQLADERDYYLKQQALALQVNDKARANEYLKLAQEREARMVEHEARAAAQAKGVDINGNPLPGYKKAADGTIVKVPKAKTPVDTVKAARKARAEREDELRKARLDAIDEADKMVTKADVVQGVKIGEDSRPSWQVAYSRLFNRYRDLLRFASKGGKKKLRARIDQMIREALVEAGWEDPTKKPVKLRRSRTTVTR